MSATLTLALILPPELAYVAVVMLFGFGTICGLFGLACCLVAKVDDQEDAR